MRRLTCFATLLALLLTSVGCYERDGANRAAPPAVQASGPVESVPDSAPVAIFDPLETDKDVLAMKKPGHWRITGEDKEGRAWEGYLVVEQAPEGYMKFGFFQWMSNAGGGRYHFEGTYDAATRRVRWTGYTIKDREGRAVNAIYEATFTEDQHLKYGSWQGGASIPGTWTGTFLHGS